MDGVYIHNPLPPIRQRRPRRHAFALIWPKDGKRIGTLGRLKDILTGEGPDIYVASHRGRGLGWDAPTKTEWTRWRELGIVDPWAETPNAARHIFPWADGDRAGRRYDFRTRNYQLYNPGLWSDALWEEGARRGDAVPLRMRTADGMWWVHNAAPLGGWHGT